MRTAAAPGARRTRGLVAAGTALAVLLGLAGCDGDPAADRAAGAGDPRSEAALRWGVAPTPHPDVTYQPDVVIVGGGGDSIRSVTDDGLTWRLNPDAPRAAELARGTVMFVTGRAVGRVLDVRRAQDDLAVTIGPVGLTEVIQDGHFTSEGPVALASPVGYAAGTPFWTAPAACGAGADPGCAEREPPTPDAEGDSSGTGIPDAGSTGAGPGPGGFTRTGTGVGTQAGSELTSRAPVVAPAPAVPKPPTLPGLPAVPATPKQPALPAVPGRPPAQPPSVEDLGKTVSAAGMRLLPVCCEGGVGTRFSYDANGVRLAGTVSLTMKRPHAGFVLGISGGTVTEARLSIDGAAGLKVDFEAARQDSRYQVDEKVAIPVDFSIPMVSILGVPFSAVVNQWVVIKTAFSATGAYLKGAGEYSFAAGLGFGYSRGAWSATVPRALTVTHSLMKSIDGISIGVTGFVLAYQARFLVGIGAFGFTAGVYFGFTASLGVTRGSDAGLYVPGTGGTIKVVCRGASLTISANYGVGYSIPKPVADVINYFLRVFKTKPIQRASGIGNSVVAVKLAQIDPDTKICGGSG
jgi:hypothetical protein